MRNDEYQMPVNLVNCSPLPQQRQKKQKENNENNLSPEWYRLEELDIGSTFSDSTEQKQGSELASQPSIVTCDYSLNCHIKSYPNTGMQ